MRQFLISLFCLFIPLITFGQEYQWEWKTFTSTHQIRNMVKVQKSIFCATEGGLLIFDSRTKSFENLTNTEGLASNNLRSIATDRLGNIWLGMYDGYLQRYNYISKNWFTVTDYKNNKIQSLSIYGDTLFVGLDIGISVYLISRNEVKETYKHLGNDINAEIPVNDMIVYGNELWAITEQGLSHVRLAESNPLDPQFWTIDKIDKGNQFILNTIIVSNDHIWLGTANGIYERQADGTWLLSEHSNQLNAIAFARSSDFLYALTDHGLYKYDHGWISTLNNLSGALSAICTGDTIYIGTENELIEIVNDAVINSYIASGPGGNLFSDLAVDQDGVLWCCSCDSRGTSGNGLYKYDHGKWVVFNKSSLPDLQTNLVVSVAIDQSNQKWIGTWGGGVMVMENDTINAIYRPQTGYLHGTSNSINYAVVKDIIVDYSNTVWMLNREAYTGDYLVSVTPQGEWTYYGTNAGLTDGLVWNMSIDSYNRKWIATNRIGGSASGVYVYDDYQEQSNHWTTSDGLLSNNIQAIAIDEAGTVWAGTEFGLNYISGVEVKQEYRVPVTNIRALLIDGANNLWVGSDKGICYLSNETYEWTWFDHTNSGLVHDEVISMILDPDQGYIYIGTSNGLSRLKTPYSSPKKTFSQLKIFPNPFIADENTNVIIENLPYDVSVSIVTSQGYTVFQKNADQVYGNTMIWDVKDANGNPVPGGIYLVVVNNDSGEKNISKLAVIR